MMVSIDVKSLLLLFALCNLFILIFFSFYILYYKERNQLYRLLIISKLTMSVVWLLFFFRGEVDAVFSIYLANVFLLFATCYEVYYVIYAIEPFDRNRFIQFNLIPVVLSIIFLFNVGQPEPVRIIIISVLSGLLYLFGGIQLYGQLNATRIQTLVSYYYMVVAGFFLIKPIFSNQLELLSSGSFLHLTAFTLGFLTSFLSAMFLLVIQKEADQQRQIFVDKEMLNTVTRNLLSNAVKFTPEGGKITIFEEKDEDQNKIRIHVKDNGVGIPETKLS